MLALFDVTSVAFLIALILTPLVRDIANRFGFVDNPDGLRKFHASPVPRVGGPAVAGAFALALCFVAVAPYRNLNVNIGSGLRVALALSPAALTILLIGVADDIRGLKPWQKLIGEVVAAVLAYYAGFGVHILRGQPLSDWISLPVTILWLVGCANALNLMDGMDGLASGVALFATITTFIAALIHHSLPLALLTAPMVGALLGFLRYNFNPASIFLGDSGSLFIGFLLGCFGTMWGEKSATAIGMTAPLIAMAMPLLDTSLAIVRRFLRGQPIFSADRGHIHHRLLDLGFTPRRAVLTLYGFCGLAAALSLIQDVVHTEFHGPVIILLCGASWIGVSRLRYAEFGITGQILFKRGSFRRMVAAQLGLQRFEQALNQTTTIHDTWDVVQAHASALGFAGVTLRIGADVFSTLTTGEAPSFWQVRVPFTASQFVNLHLNPARDVHPAILVTFPKILEGFLASRYPETAGRTLAQRNAEPAETLKTRATMAAI